MLERLLRVRDELHDGPETFIGETLRLILWQSVSFLQLARAHRPPSI